MSRRTPSAAAVANPLASAAAAPATAEAAAVAVAGAAAPAAAAAAAAAKPPLDKDAADVRVARILFFAGCALLPWLWILLMLHFSRRWREPECPPALRMYLRRAALGCAIYTALFVTWVALFQTQWRKWGTFGTTMLIYVPPTTWWTDDNAT